MNKENIDKIVGTLMAIWSMPPAGILMFGLLVGDLGLGGIIWFASMFLFVGWVLLFYPTGREEKVRLSEGTKI